MQDRIKLSNEQKLSTWKSFQENQINQAWKDVVAKKARFRYVIDAATI